MADDEEVELESLPDMSNYDHDLEYLVRQRNPSIDISRERLNEARFEAGFSPVPKSRALRARLISALPPEPIRTALTPPLTLMAWFQFLLNHVPIIRWLWSYQAKFVINDIVSGVTVSIMHIPQGLAYALLANLEPVYGLYASFMPAIVYSFLGTSRHLSVGTFAVVELMIGNSIDKVLSSDPRLQSCVETNDVNETAGSGIDDSGILDICRNMSDVTNTTVDCAAERVSIAITIAMVSGLFMLVMGVLQLGFISIFLSESLVSGYTTGAACHVFTSQLTHILGIKISVPPGLFTIPRTWIKGFGMITDTNVATLIISIMAMIVLIAFKFINNLLKRAHVPIPFYSRGQRKWKIKKVKWTIPLPAPLIVLIVFTLISYLAKFEENYTVKIVGDIPQGAPALTNPFTGYLSSVIIDSFVIAIIVYSVSISLARKFAVDYDYTIHSNQEFIAYGTMNIISSFFSSFTAAGSLSRSVIQGTSGGKTQLVGFVSSGIILVVLLWLGALFEPLPRAVLAATIWVALYGMFKQVKHVWQYFKLSFSDFLIWVVVFLATVFLGVDLGLGVGVAFSLFVIIYRTILPYSSVLGQAGNTEIFRNTDNFQVETIPGVFIFRFMAPICFVNAAVFRTRLEMICDLHKKQQPGGEEKGCFQKVLPPPEQCLRRRGGYDVTRAEEELHDPTINRSASFQRAMETDMVSDRDLRVAPIPKRKQLVHTVVIDCAPISFLDAVGVKALKQLVLDFDKCGVQVLFAAMTKENRDMLDRAKFYELCGKEWLFPSIQDAVHHARFGNTLHPAGEEELTRGGEGGEEGEVVSELPTSNGESPTAAEHQREANTQQQQQQQQQQQEEEEEGEVARVEESTSFMEPLDMQTTLATNT